MWIEINRLIILINSHSIQIIKTKKSKKIFWKILQIPKKNTYFCTINLIKYITSLSIKPYLSIINGDKIFPVRFLYIRTPSRYKEITRENYKNIIINTN